MKIRLPCKGFNSTMVRLKGYPHTLDTPQNASFNSTMVRLKGVLFRRIRAAWQVSIPQWFD